MIPWNSTQHMPLQFDRTEIENRQTKPSKKQLLLCWIAEYGSVYFNKTIEVELKTKLTFEVVFFPFDAPIQVDL